MVCWIAVLLQWGRAQQAASPIEEQFKYGSIGAEDQEGIPYWIWQVLPRLFADKPAHIFKIAGIKCHVAPILKPAAG